MKNKLLIIITLIAAFGFNISCTKIEPNTPPDKEDITGLRALIIGEGQFGYGTGSITSLTHDKIVTQDVFRTINNRPIGDVPQSLAHIGENYYIPVNNSGKIEVINAKTFKSVETLVLSNDVIPMYVEHLGGDEIIVSDQSTHSKLMIVDINHNTDRKIVKRVIDIKFRTFQMKVIGKKIFIAGDKLSVFDLDDINENSRRSVKGIRNNDFATSDFTKLCLDKNGFLWALTSSGTVCIDPSTEKVIKEISVKGISMRWGALDIDKEGENLYIISGTSVYTINIDNQVEPVAPIIKHSANDDNWVSYAMGVSKENTVFIIRVLFGSITRGRVFEYDLNGNIVNKYLDTNDKEQNFFRAGIFPHYIHFL